MNTTIEKINTAISGIVGAALHVKYGLITFFTLNYIMSLAFAAVFTAFCGFVATKCFEVIYVRYFKKHFDHLKYKHK